MVGFFVIANMANEKHVLKGPKYNIHYCRIFVTLGSGIAGFHCAIDTPWATHDIELNEPHEKLSCLLCL